MRTRKYWFIFGLLVALSINVSGQTAPVTAEKNAELKQQILKAVEGNAKLVQVMVDTMYSFGELGFQEFETSKYLTDLLEKNGFKVEHGIAGIPTAWMASWGSGEPVIALGSDIDCIPQASQKPEPLRITIRLFPALPVMERGTIPVRQ